MKNKNNKFRFLNQNTFLICFFFSAMLGSFLFFGVGRAWGATYYAGPTGSGTTCSLAAPCALDYTVATKAGSGDTVIALSGTYGPFNGITFAGVPKTVTTDGGIVTVSFNSGQSGFYLSSGAAGSVINGFTFTGAGTYNIDNRASNVIISNCTFDSLLGTAIYNITGTGNIVSHCVFKDITGRAYYGDTNGATTINYSQFYRCGLNTFMDVLMAVSGNILTVNNSDFAGGGKRSMVRGSGLGTTVTVNNSNFIGSGGMTKYPDGTIQQANSATVTVNNSILGSSMLKTGLITSGNVTFNNVQQSTDPEFHSLGYNEAIVTFYSVDSNHLTTGSLSHYQTVADTHGAHFTYFPDDTDQSTMTEYFSTLQDFVEAGHDLGCEAKSSSPLDTGIPFTVSYSGTGTNPQIVIARTSDNDMTLVCKTDSGTDLTLEIGKTQTYKYIDSGVTPLASAISAHEDWEATVIDGVTGDYDDVYSYTLAEGIYDISGDTNILLDKTGRYFNEEIVLSKSDIENVMGNGYTVKSFFYPRYKTDDDALVTVKAAGYTVALAGQDNAYQLSSIDNIYSLSNDTMVNNVWWNTNMKGSGYDALTTTQKEIRVKAWARDLALGMKFYGHWFAFCLPENSALPAAEFGWILSELQKMGVQVLSFSEAQEYISSTSTESGDGYTRTFAQDYAALLQSTSPAIDAGTDVSLTTDFEGDPIYGLPDIGGYEFQPPFEMGKDGIDISSGARIYGDGKFRDYEGEGEGDTANLSVAPESGEFTTYEDDEARPLWMDITDITWGSGRREWKESSDTLGETNTLHTISNLTAGNTYTLTIDGDSPAGFITGTDCTETGACVADGNGQIAFVFTGGYSEHTFSLAGEDEEEIDDEDNNNNDNNEDNNERDLNTSKIKASSTPDSITIEWKTDYKTRSTLKYGTNRNLSEKKKDNDKEKKHKMTIANLLPNTKYYFKIKSEDGDDNEDRSKIHFIKTKANQSSNSNQNQSDTTQTTQETPSYSQSQGSNPALCSYTTQEGDTLWNIAKKVYGDPTNYPQIIEKNKDKYPDIASKLSIGQELTFCENKVQGLSETKTENGNGNSNNDNSEIRTQEPEYARWWNPFSWF